MGKYKAIIFDLDGVIVSTDHLHYLAWKALADKLGIPFNQDINNRFRGVSRMACMDIFEELSGNQYSYEEKEQYATWKNNYYRELLRNLTPLDLSNEVKDTLIELRANGLKLAIGSSSKNAKLILERIGLPQFFDAISDGTNITNSKPHPEVFLKAADFLSCRAEDCLVVEDAVAGISAANAAGMDSASVGDAATQRQGIYILNNFRDLLTIAT